MKKPPLEKAIELVGGQTALGKLIGKRQSTVRSWLLNKKVPAEMTSEIELATKGEVTRKDLRPDLFA